MPEEIFPPEHNREANSTHRLSRLELQRAMTDVNDSWNRVSKATLTLTR